MVWRPRFAAVLVASSLAGAATPVAPIGPDAVWKPPADFRAAVADACANAGAKFPACFAGRMRAAGASEAALAFARRTKNQGYLSAFRDTGRVDVAYVEYPFRANENALVFLVNGEPSILDVDDPSRLDRKNLEANAVYAGLRTSFPGLAVFPGDRRPGHGPHPVELPDGGQRFILSYELHDGCHACRTVGLARIGFDFDERGKFVGTEVVHVRTRSR